MKSIFLIVALLPFVSTAAEKSFTLMEVEKHATPKDCWMVIEEKVYDVSSYISKHPAPEAVLVKYCGKKADEGWTTKDQQKPHSRAAARLLKRFLVGSFSGG